MSLHEVFVPDSNHPRFTKIAKYSKADSIIIDVISFLCALSRITHERFVSLVPYYSTSLLSRNGVPMLKAWCSVAEAHDEVRASRVGNIIRGKRSTRGQQDVASK